MLILLRTYSTDEHFNSEYDYAVIKIEEYEAIKIHQYGNLYKFMKESQPDFVEMTFRPDDDCIVCEFFSCNIFDTANGELDAMPDDVRKQMDNLGYAVFPKGYHPEFTPKDAHAPEDIFLKFCSEGFYWEAFPYNTMIKIDTQVLPMDILAQVI